MGGFVLGNCFSKRMKVLRYKVSKAGQSLTSQHYHSVYGSSSAVFKLLELFFIQKALGQRDQKGNGFKHCSCCVPIVCCECKAQQQHLKGRSSDAPFWLTKLFTSLHLMRHFYFPLTLNVTFLSLLQRNHVMLLVIFCISAQRLLQNSFFFSVFQCCW